MTRTDIADSLAIGARVFVRKARREGAMGTFINDDVIQGIAQERGISGDRYSMRTVWMLVRRYGKDSGELDMIAPDRRPR